MKKLTSLLLLMLLILTIPLEAQKSMVDKDEVINIKNTSTNILKTFNDSSNKLNLNLNTILRNNESVVISGTAYEIKYTSTDGNIISQSIDKYGNQIATFQVIPDKTSIRIDLESTIEKNSCSNVDQVVAKYLNKDEQQIIKTLNFSMVNTKLLLESKIFKDYVKSNQRTKEDILKSGVLGEMTTDNVILDNLAQYLADNTVNFSKEYLLREYIERFGGITIFNEIPNFEYKLVSIANELECVLNQNKSILKPLIIREDTLKLINLNTNSSVPLVLIESTDPISKEKIIIVSGNEKILTLGKTNSNSNFDQNKINPLIPGLNVKSGISARQLEFNDDQNTIRTGASNNFLISLVSFLLLFISKIIQQRKLR